MTGDAATEYLPTTWNGIVIHFQPSAKLRREKKRANYGVTLLESDCQNREMFFFCILELTGGGGAEAELHMTVQPVSLGTHDGSTCGR